MCSLVADVVAVHVDAGCGVDPEGGHALHLWDLLKVAGVAAVEAAHHNHHVRLHRRFHHLVDSVLPLLQSNSDSFPGQTKPWKSTHCLGV